MRNERQRVMTLKQIYRKYPNQWVLISEPRLTKDLEVIEGTVVAHSKDVDAIYKIIRTGRYPRGAIEFTGHIPRNVGIAFYMSRPSCDAVPDPLPHLTSRSLCERRPRHGLPAPISFQN